MKYIEFINQYIRKEISKHEGLVLFGQNIGTGSMLGGLTKGINEYKKGKIVNTPNSENTLVGFGFGMMIGGVSSLFFMKQLDFLMLGLDQVVNTHNFIKNWYKEKMPASFTIVPIIMDNGYQGVQSSVNNFADVCSLARIPGFVINTATDAEKILSQYLVAPGFRIIGVSQRLFKEEIFVHENIISARDDSTLFQYNRGDNATIVCFNFSFSYGYELQNQLKEKNISSSLFTVNALTPVPWEEIIHDCARTKNLVLIDDSKSANSALTALESEAMAATSLDRVIIVRRILGNDWLQPVSDAMPVNYAKINEIFLQKASKGVFVV